MARLTLRSILRNFVFIGILVSLLVYVVFQARLLIIGPQITIQNETSVHQNSRQIALEGTARNITHMTLNGRQIYTDEHGYFKEALVLENGYTIATLRAEDRYGRQTTVSRSFVYTPASMIIN